MDDRTLRRVENLVRLAESTHSDGERKNALRECVRLFDDAPKRGRGRTAAHRSPPPPPPPANPWHEVVAAAGGTCPLCSCRYGAGEVVWWRSTDNVIVHGDCW